MGDRMGNWDWYNTTSSAHTMTLWPVILRVISFSYYFTSVSHLCASAPTGRSVCSYWLPTLTDSPQSADWFCKWLGSVSGFHIWSLPKTSDIGRPTWKPEIRCVWPGSPCLPLPLKYSKDFFNFTSHICCPVPYVVTPNGIPANPPGFLLWRRGGTGTGRGGVWDFTTRKNPDVFLAMIIRLNAWYFCLHVCAWLCMITMSPCVCVCVCVCLSRKSLTLYWIWMYFSSTPKHYTNTHPHTHTLSPTHSDTQTHIDVTCTHTHGTATGQRRRHRCLVVMTVGIYCLWVSAQRAREGWGGWHNSK